MKHLFIVNPCAGKYDHTGELTDAIRSAFANTDEQYEILVSRSEGDCTRIAEAAAASGESLRIYACGGDGTLNEVVNGVAGYDNVAITNLPCGTGNDFIRIFSDPNAFRSIHNLLDAKEASFDLIRCNKKHYSINICSMGLDARIGTQVGKYKRLPMLSGHGAYLLSSGVNVIKGMHRHYIVEVDDQVINDELTMICIANGRWYGGGFYAASDAQPDDGLLDVMLVRKMSRLTAATVIGKYKEGRYKELTNVIDFRRCRKITIHCDEPSEISLDGELLMGKDVTFEVIPNALRFFYPKTIGYSKPAPVGKR